MFRPGRNPKDTHTADDTADHTPQTPAAGAGSSYGSNAPAAAAAAPGATPTEAYQQSVYTQTTSRAVTESESLARDIKEGTLTGFVGNDPALLRSIYADFADSVAQGATELHALYARGDCGALAAFAHRLKATARFAGAGRLAHLTDRLEAESRRANRAAVDVLVPQWIAEAQALARLIAIRHGGGATTR